MYCHRFSFFYSKCRRNISLCSPGLAKPLHSAFTAVPFFKFILPVQASVGVKNMCLYTHIWLRRDCIWINVATKQQCEWNFFTQIGSGAKCWLDVYHWFEDLAATGRICDIGQKLLQFSFQTGSSSRLSYSHIFFLIEFLEKASIRNIIIILCVNYTI